MSGDEFDEIWINLADGRSMCGLIRGDVGWLIYIREAGDAGFSSRNPDYAGPPDAEIEYRLNNGQRDRYPAAWAISSREVRRALSYFEEENQIPSWITWANDSGDGTSPC